MELQLAVVDVVEPFTAAWRHELDVLMYLYAEDLPEFAPFCDDDDDDEPCSPCSPPPRPTLSFSPSDWWDARAQVSARLGQHNTCAHWSIALERESYRTIHLFRTAARDWKCAADLGPMTQWKILGGKKDDEGGNKNEEGGNKDEEEADNDIDMSAPTSSIDMSAPTSSIDMSAPTSSSPPVIVLVGDSYDARMEQCVATQRLHPSSLVCVIDPEREGFLTALSVRDELMRLLRGSTVRAAHAAQADREDVRAKMLARRKSTQEGRRSGGGMEENKYVATNTLSLPNTPSLPNNPAPPHPSRMLRKQVSAQAGFGTTLKTLVGPVDNVAFRYALVVLKNAAEVHVRWVDADGEILPERTGPRTDAHDDADYSFKSGTGNFSRTTNGAIGFFDACTAAHRDLDAACAEGACAVVFVGSYAFAPTADFFRILGAPERLALPPFEAHVLKRFPKCRAFVGRKREGK